MTTDERFELFWKMAKAPQEELNAMFNSGVFNSMAIAYGKQALKIMGYTETEIKTFETKMEYAFSEYSLEEVMK